MRLGVTGTANGLTPEQTVTFVRDALPFLRPLTHFHHGDCVGADEELARLTLFYSTLPPLFVIHPPTNGSKRAFWTSGPCEYRDARPYLDRNHDIVNASDLLLACPGEAHEVLRSGTWATVRYARKVNKPVWIIYPDGSLIKEDQS